MSFNRKKEPVFNKTLKIDSEPVQLVAYGTFFYSPVDVHPTVIKLYLRQGDRYFEDRHNKPDALAQAAACYNIALSVATELDNKKGKFEAQFKVDKCNDEIQANVEADAFIQDAHILQPSNKK